MDYVPHCNNVGVYRFSKKSRSHLKILGARRVSKRKSYSQHPRMLGATLQNLVARNFCTPAIKYACIQCNLRHCAARRKVAVLTPDGVIEIFHWLYPSGRSMALGSYSASIRNEQQEYFLWRPVRRADNLTTSMCRLSRDNGSFNLQEPSGSVQACARIAIQLFSRTLVLLTNFDQWTLRRPLFGPRPVFVWFLVDQVALGRDCLRVISVSPLSFLPSVLHIFIHLSPTLWWVFSFTSRPLYPRARAPDTHRIRARVGLWVGMDTLQERQISVPPKNQTTIPQSML